jgi:hypothetical protein
VQKAPAFETGDVGGGVVSAIDHAAGAFERSHPRGVNDVTIVVDEIENAAGHAACGVEAVERNVELIEPAAEDRCKQPPKWAEDSRSRRPRVDVIAGGVFVEVDDARIETPEVGQEARAFADVEALTLGEAFEVFLADALRIADGTVEPRILFEFEATARDAYSCLRDRVLEIAELVAEPHRPRLRRFAATLRRTNGAGGACAPRRLPGRRGRRFRPRAPAGGRRRMPLGTALRRTPAAGRARQRSTSW